MEVEKPAVSRAMDMLGKGFDICSDFRLRYAKGMGGEVGGERLVVLEVGDSDRRDLVIPGFGGLVVRDVPSCIRCDKGDQIRFQSDVLPFDQMSKFLNQESSIEGKIPSGYFNSIFDMSGNWLRDDADTKCLALDGFFIALCYMHLTTSPLALKEEVKKSVPSYWDAALLSRFIRSYGTHIIVGFALGGQDLICVRQTKFSQVSPADLRAHLEGLGDFLFSDGASVPKYTNDIKNKVLEVFQKILQSKAVQLPYVSETSGKDGLTITITKRGGDVFPRTHSSWLQTVSANPEAILFKFVPITSLLTGIPGSGYLSHAINLYMRYKPPLDDLQSFLEFQVPKQWAPLFCELPLRHHQKCSSSSYLRFNFMGPKLYVNSTQVVTGRKPVVGLRLYLEGKKADHLALHLQHLSGSPDCMAPSPTELCRWRGSDELETANQYLEAVRWSRLSKVCTSAVKHDSDWMEERSDGVYIVSGAQLYVKGKWPKTVLHLRLLFTFLPNLMIRKTEWSASPAASHKYSLLSNISTSLAFSRSIPGAERPTAADLNSGVYPRGPPVPVRSSKLLKYMEAEEIVRGPHNPPGHWLVTAAKLVAENGKVGLNAKFALLDHSDCSF